MKHYVVAMLLLSLAMPVPAVAEGISAEEALTNVSEQIGKLIHLRWKEGRIGVDREKWMEHVGQKTEAEKEKERLDGMIERGVPADIARRRIEEVRRKRIAARRRGTHEFHRSDPPEQELFEGLTTAARANSRGRSGDGEGTNYRGSSGREKLKMAMYVNRTTSEFRFTISQSKAPFQEFDLQEHPEKGLLIEFSSSSGRILWLQGADGRVQFARFNGKSTEASSCPSYDDMVGSHPEFTETLEGLLEQLGINRPFKRSDPRIVSAVLRIIELTSSEDVAAVDEAIAKLGADKHKEREAAQREIEKNLQRWRRLLRQRLADSQLELEVKTRLNRVMEQPEAEESSEEEFIDRRNLLQDADYLSFILSDAPKSLKPAIRKRIEGLGGED